MGFGRRRRGRRKKSDHPHALPAPRAQGGSALPPGGCFSPDWEPAGRGADPDSGWVCLARAWRKGAEKLEFRLQIYVTQAEIRVLLVLVSKWDGRDKGGWHCHKMLA